MDKMLFDQLVESVTQMGEIARGERAPSREHRIDSQQIKRIRQRTRLSQVKFARLIDVEVSTLRNWEQGRREPTGPAKALLTVIDRNPQAVIEALHG